MGDKLDQRMEMVTKILKRNVSVVREAERRQSAEEDTRRRPSMDGMDTSSDGGSSASDEGMRKGGVTGEDDVVVYADAGVHSPTMWDRAMAAYVSFCYERPVGWLVVLMVVGSILSGVGNMYFVNTPATNTEWLITSDKYTARMDAYLEVNAAITKEASTASGATAERSVVQNSYTFSYLYKGIDGNDNVWTPQSIAQMRKDDLRIRDAWSKVCFRAVGETEECSAPYSAMNFFYPTILSASCDPESPATTCNPLTDFKFDGQGTEQVDVDYILTFLSSDLYTFGYFFGADFSASNLGSRHGRATYMFGMPLHGYTDEEDRAEEQEAKIEKMQQELEADLFSYYDLTPDFILHTAYSHDEAVYSAEGGDVNVMWKSDYILELEGDRLIQVDFSWAGASLLAVWCFQCYHTGSFLIGSVGMMQVIFSFMVSLLFYKFALGIEYFSSIHGLAIFIILGIGADNVFVYTDAFAQSITEAECLTSEKALLLSRIIYSSIRASKAIATTSLTTMIAFLTTGLTPIMPIASFGIFAGCMIAFLYLINILVVPPLVLTWARHFEPLPFARCAWCFYRPHRVDLLKVPFMRGAARVLFEKKAQGFFSLLSQAEDPEAAAEVITEMDRRDDIGVELDKEERTCLINCAAPELPEYLRDGVAKAPMRIVERFFNDTYSPLLFKGRYVVAILFAAFGSGAMWCALQLRPPQELEPWYPTTHELQEFGDTFSSAFGQSGADEVQEVLVMYGLKGMDSSSVNFWDNTERGTLVWDKSFNMSSPEAQQFIYDLCEGAKTAVCKADECSEKLLVRNGETKCWIDGFKTFVEARGMSFPVAAAQFIPEVVSFASVAANQLQYPRQLGLFQTDNGDYELRFMALSFAASFTPPIPIADVVPIRDRWEEWMEDQNKIAPEGVRGGLQNALGLWAISVTMETLVSGALQGMAICFAASFVVLALSTMNLLIALFATLTIVGIVSSVLGYGVWLVMDWDLGIAESIASVIVIGFSVDYCVHLANHYVESTKYTRYEKMQESLMAMGVSVLAGSLTTFLSGFMLFFAIMTFFTKFSFLICATIVFSLIWSLGFFSAFMMILGPEGSHDDMLGSITWMYGGDTPKGVKPAEEATEPKTDEAIKSRAAVVEA